MSNKKNRIYQLLFEEDRIDTPESSVVASQTKIKARKALDSVDDQIDALILRYEASSIKDEKDSSNINEVLKNKSLKFILEQDEGPGETAEPEEEAKPEESPTPTGSEEMSVDQPADEVLVPDLDMDAFAARSVRLISNYKSLLRIEEAIINRFKHFLDENYGDKFVQRYVEILEKQFGITVEEFDNLRDIKDDDFAVGAYAAGAGGSGA